MRRGKRATGAIGAAIAVLGLGGAAWGQAGSDFTIPQIVLETGGHQGPPRAIVFTPDGRQMLSGGFDKVVRVWNFQDGRLEPSRVIRPPIWRGLAGNIYAMALSPRPLPGEKGQYYLAVAGHGVAINGGNITLFRFPGPVEKPAGDIVTQLPTVTFGQKQTEGHTKTVMALAFSPDGKTLASAGMDGKVCLWDVAGKRVIGELVPSQWVSGAQPAPVNVLAYSGDGRWLVTGGADGLTCLWNAATKQLAFFQPSPPVRGDDRRSRSILSMAVNPGPLQWIVVGRENGVMHQYGADMRQLGEILSTGAGPVEAMAASPDGRFLVTSIVSKRLEKISDYPSVDCTIQPRKMPSLEPVGPGVTSDNLTYAVAFSPDGRYLVYGGGDSQPLVVRDRKGPAEAIVRLEGNGRSIWDIGWRADSRAVAYARTPAGAGTEYEGYDLFDRKVVEVEPQGLAREQSQSNGYSVRPIDPLTLEIVTPAGKVNRLALHDEKERRWWEWSFIPPAKGHDKTVLAVGCESGVLLVDPESGKRLRMFAGPAGPVYALAPSPDGRWLAAGSSDQTIRICPLAGCDQLARLGVSFERRPDGRWQVKTVEPLAFGDRDMMQLKPGDIALWGSILKQVHSGANLPNFARAADEVEPFTTIQMQVQRDGRVLNMTTTKRDSPALSLFVGTDREWVLWMPQGYYETSILGDRKYLVWHRNGGPNATEPSETFPADRFEAELRLPAVLATLMTTGDVAQALAAVPVASRAPEVLVAAGAPPLVTIAGPPGRLPDQVFTSNNGVVTITPTVTVPGGRSPLASVRVQVEGQTVIGPGPPPAGPINVPVPPGRHRVNIIAVNAQGRERVEGFDVEVAAPPEQPPRLALLSIGVNGPFVGGDYPPIDFADADARDVSGTLGRVGGKVFPEIVAIPPVAGADATTKALEEAMYRLKGAELGPGDTLMVMLESHYVGTGPDGRFVANDAKPADVPEGGLPAKELADSLAAIAAGGCRVLVLVDAVHPGTDPDWAAEFHEWVRGLYPRGVIAFIAANNGPSQRRSVNNHGAFAQALIEAPTARAQFRRFVPADVFTLDEFQRTVVRRVEELTTRKQQALCMFPETISPASRLFDAGRNP